MEQPAQANLNVALKRNGNILLSVGGFGVPQSITPLDFIRVCVRREQVRRTTNREHNNN